MRVFRILMIGGFVGIGMMKSARASLPEVTLQPLLTNESCWGAPELVGNWDLDIAGPQPVAIQKLEDCKYRMLMLNWDEGRHETYAFDIRFGRLDGTLFFDAIDQIIRADQTEVIQDAFWMAPHFVGIVRTEDTDIHLLLLSDDWLRERLKTWRIEFTMYQGDECLTAPTSDLQEFFTCFANDPKAFSVDVALRRAATTGSSK